MFNHPKDFFNGLLTRDPEKDTKARHGSKTFELKGRALTRSTESELLAPGQVGQMDATTADIYLVADHDPTIIVGRPTLYGIKDAFLRFLYSLIVTLERPSYWGGSMALENALVSKVDYCAGYGITISEDEWPVQFLPKKILVDGGEMSTYKTDHLICGLGLDIGTLPRGRGDLKGIIEQHFRKINGQLINWLPGALPKMEKDFVKRHELDAVLTVSEFRYLVIEAILKYHRTLLKGYDLSPDMMRAGIQKRPLDMLLWAREHRSGLFRTVPLEQARLQLLPAAAAVVTKEGIRFNKVFYTCERAVSEKWFERARLRGTFEVEIAFDVRGVEPIYLRNSKTVTVEPCHLISHASHFKGWTWEALEEEFRREKVAEIQSRPIEAQDQVELHAKARRICDNAGDRQKLAFQANPGQSVASRLNKIPENRAAAKAKERADSLNASAIRGSTPAVVESGKIIVLNQESAKPAIPAAPVELIVNVKLRAFLSKSKTKP